MEFNMRYLGVDYGHKKVGLAISDEGGHFAYPYSVIPNDKRLYETIKKVCEREKIAKIVIGESLDLKGQPNPIMAGIQAFAAEIKKITGLDAAFEQEYYTTQEADRLIGRDKNTDARAAALILKSYLDKHS